MDVIDELYLGTSDSQPQRYITCVLRILIIENE
jgi:hypothetical protein